jgi:chemotaxis protein methyltransferase CheR
MLPADDDLETLEIQLLLEGIFQRYGYDFREYALASLRRRIWNFAAHQELRTISAVQEKVLHDPAWMERLLPALTVSVTSFFRDAGFFLAFRSKVAPLLRTYPYLRIWHAGCSTGEEAYSLAILLQEEGLYGRTRIYATDMHQSALRRAREGIYPLDFVDEYAANYNAAGGSRSFSDYFTTGYGHAVLRSPLKENLIFSQHNLVTDGSFNEFNIILCRNVLIYFQKPLQHRVHRLIYESLGTFGLLGLGNRESIQFTPHAKDYEPLDPDWKLYRRIR